MRDSFRHWRFVNGSLEEDKTIFRVYLETESIAQVQAHLQVLGVKSRRGNIFSAQALADILSNRFYVGELVHGDVKRQGNHEALISKVTFGKVQALKERNRKR